MGGEALWKVTTALSAFSSQLHPACDMEVTWHGSCDASATLQHGERVYV